MRKKLFFSVALGVIISFNAQADHATDKRGMLILRPIFASDVEQNPVRGVVRDANGPLAGVTVSIVGKSVSVQTDENGIYSINATTGDKLRFTNVGHVQREIEVTSNALNVMMQVDRSEEHTSELLSR